MTAPQTDPAASTRLDEVRSRARAHGVDTLVLTPGEDLLYLLGARMDSHERLTALVVGSDGSTPTLVLPTLELTAAARGAADTVGARVVPWSDGEDAVALVADLAHGKVAVSGSTPATHVVALQSVLGTTVELTGPAVDPVRAAKSPWEIERLADAARRIDEVHHRMGEFLTAGSTERKVAARIERAIEEVGLVRTEFVIVGSGPNGADPHHCVSDRVIAHGDVVVVDIGGPVAEGYHSDCTRTYVLGEPTAEVARDYASLERAQLLARETVRPGIAIGEVDAAARNHLDQAGLGRYFTHRTGHGIGLGLHEPPFAAPGADTVLVEGMTFSIEPGIYRAGGWGARLEDIVVVTAHGVRELNTVERGLRVL